MVTSTVDGFLYPADVTAQIDFVSPDQDLSVLSTLMQHSLVSSTFAVELLLLLPLVAVTMRRLRDAGWKPWIAIAAYSVNYFGLIVAVALTSQSLAILTQAGTGLTEAQATETLSIVAQMLGVALLDFVAMITLLVGTLRPTKSIDS